jgi:hypothetical protein
MSAAKRPVSDRFKDDKKEKKQKKDGNDDITVGDGVYKDDVDTQPETRSLPFRPPESQAVMKQSAASSDVDGAEETQRLSHAVFNDTKGFVGHLHQIHVSDPRHDGSMALSLDSVPVSHPNC